MTQARKTDAVPPEAAAAMSAAQGVTLTPEGATTNARFASLVLGNSAKAFDALAFEAEPSGYVAELRANAK